MGLCLLDSGDYAEIALSLGRDTNSVKKIIETGQFRKLRVKDLKDIIRHLRRKDCITFGNVSLQGRKNDLVQSLRSALNRTNLGATSTSDLVSGLYTNTKIGKPLDKTKVYNGSLSSSSRSPFFSVVQKLWWGDLALKRGLMDNFKISSDTTAKLSRNDEIYQLHLVMVDEKSRLQPFDGAYRIKINGHTLNTPLPRVVKGQKKKGLLVHPVVNIPAYTLMGYQTISIRVELSMPLELFCNKPCMSVLAVELVQVLSSEEVLKKHLDKAVERGKKMSKIASKNAAPPPVPSVTKPPPSPKHVKSCQVCGSTQHLLRCSRCKARWYCGQEHQRKDWNRHRDECFDSSNPHSAAAAAAAAHKAAEAQALTARKAAEAAAAAVAAAGSKRSRASMASSSRQTDSSEDILESDVLITLNCPLSVSRIEKAARGKNCKHPQCFDLLTFIMYSEQSHVWQCPVCLKPLPIGDIIVDEKMDQMIAQCDEEISQVRLAPDGSFTPVKPKDPNEEPKPKKKRKRNKPEKTEITNLYTMPPPGHPRGGVFVPTDDISVGDGEGTSFDTAIVLD
mmetsp:Transcript_25772/g.45747  ORF Transcript_25772/g.45747 Transcript_25772/m.45747 type:complete len:563 (-) Transcript_25772:88-1776(-)|eukprot:CAMPEP_0197534300 /NCGR_PEP_ID=MMETSP1318-20131121/46625_1 /TAXON_ID=552666 /ORGANISM="Partenskyella glossopodia, Strain RCC365" /LENGTH=562 /DNA_ID=CAMNT_0043091509 /DNA_START=1 /DNA_END=1689 /DNA_ORIENTATION=-